MTKDLSNQGYSLKSFENWLNAVEGRNKGLERWSDFIKIWLEKYFKNNPTLTKRNRMIWEIHMKGAKHSEAKEYAETFLEWLENQKVEDEKELTREELRKELEKSIEIKEKELQQLKERLKRIS